MERCRQNIRVSRGTQTPKETNQTSLESKKQIPPGQGSRTGLGSLGLRTLRSTKEESFSLAILRRCGGRERKHCRSRQPRCAKLRAKAKMEKAVSRKSRRIGGTFSKSSAGAAASRGFVNPQGALAARRFGDWNQCARRLPHYVEGPQRSGTARGALCDRAPRESRG